MSPSGSDRNRGTQAQPWRTVQKALDTLRAGELVLVRAGVYEQNLVMRRAGTAAAPITVRNFPGERPVLRPAAASPSYPLRLTTGAAFVRFSGFVIENAVGQGVVNVYGAGSSPGAHDYEISYCEIRNARNASGLFIDNTNYHVHLLNNHVHSNNEPGVQHQGIYLESDNSVIAGNVVDNHTNGFGIQVRTDLPAGPSNVIVANNTTVGNSMSGIVIEHTAANVTIVNNISAFNGGTGIRGYYAEDDHPNDPVGGGNVVHHNIAFGNGSYGNFHSDPAGGAPILTFLDNLQTDPLFVNRAGRDYRVQTGSPAIDRALGAFTPGADFTGAPRPQGAGPDYGAFER